MPVGASPRPFQGRSRDQHTEHRTWKCNIEFSSTGQRGESYWYGALHAADLSGSVCNTGTQAAGRDASSLQGLSTPVSHYQADIAVATW